MVFCRPQTNTSHVAGRDGHCTQQGGIARQRLRGNPAAHAMAADGDAIDVDREPLGVLRRPNEREDSTRILEILRKPKVPGTSPRTAIIESHHSPACTTHGLREV